MVSRRKSDKLMGKESSDFDVMKSAICSDPSKCSDSAREAEALRQSILYKDLAIASLENEIHNLKSIHKRELERVIAQRDGWNSVYGSAQSSIEHYRSRIEKYETSGFFKYLWLYFVGE